MEALSVKTMRGHEWIAGENCDFIEEHPARGEGDRWFYDIHLPDTIIRIFDPLEVRLVKDEVAP